MCVGLLDRLVVCFVSQLVVDFLAYSYVCACFVCLFGVFLLFVCINCFVVFYVVLIRMFVCICFWLSVCLVLFCCSCVGHVCLLVRPLACYWVVGTVG